MHTALLLLALAASPPVLLEPQPEGARRLQPRRVTASSFLKNGWNESEENYLPPYIADDDATTAWVEGAKGKGEGESVLWLGPELQRARRFRVFLRAGYQKTEVLWRANARPRRVRLEPVLQGETGAVAVGAPLEVELRDTLGWQEVALPTPPRVTGVRLTVLSVFPGRKYEDLCISDLRVYVEGEDTYRPELEAAALEELRRFSAERRAAAKRKGLESRVRLAPGYRQELLLRGPSRSEEDWLEAFEKVAVLKSVLPRARAMLELEVEAARARYDADWMQVTVGEVYEQRAPSAVALAAMHDDSFPEAVQYLNLADFVARADSPEGACEVQCEVERRRAADGKRKPGCVSACVELAQKEEAAAKKLEEALAEEQAEEEPSEAPAEKQDEEEPPDPPSYENSLKTEVWVKNEETAPTALMHTRKEVIEGRDSRTERTQWLVVSYQRGRAEVVLTRTTERHDFPTEQGPWDRLSIHVLAWEPGANGRALLKSITSLSLTGEGVTAYRYSSLW